jgi:hypothetical protein
MIRASAAILCLIAVAGCSSINVQPGGQALISGHTPPDANSAMGEPQPANSLPPGAEGMGTGPTARQTSYGAITIRSPLL